MDELELFAQHIGSAQFIASELGRKKETVPIALGRDPRQLPSPHPQGYLQLLGSWPSFH